MSIDDTHRIADAAADNWVDAYAPDRIKPYLKLARADRPIGTWLLLFPCWWSLALGHIDNGQGWINVWYLALFAVGAFVMRGAGCTWNDIVDRDYDGRVQRTALRPIPAGLVTARQALFFAVGLSLIGFLVLIQFNWTTIAIGVASLALVAAYPFAKRYTFWPQIVLGATFNWGALVGYAAITGTLEWAAVLLYLGAIAWTVGYDTIYAHQDTDDDAMLGLKSSALRLGDMTRPALIGFYGLTLVLWTAALLAVDASSAAYLAIAVIGVQFAWQIATLDIANSANCLVRFKSNRFVGWLLFAGLVIEILTIQL
ncbi:MAG: 4-hydroxybenzoate octaprenyltransferase [Pseudomonadota bacterium]